MLVICLLFLLDRLIILKNAVCPVEIFLLCHTGILQHGTHITLMLRICLTELSAHRLIEICRVVGIVCLSVFKLGKCPAKILKLCFERKIHFLQESIQYLPDRILLAFRHRRYQHIQRIVHLLEGRRDNLFKAARHLYREFLCHLLHGCGLILLAGNQDIHRFTLCCRHDICMESIQEFLKTRCH